MEDDVLNLCNTLKADYLDNRGISVRKFSKICKIKRGRLEKIISGKSNPTHMELAQITLGIGMCEQQNDTKLGRVPEGMSELSSMGNMEEFSMPNDIEDMFKEAMGDEVNE